MKDLNDLKDLKDLVRRLTVRQMKVLVTEFPVPPPGAVVPERIEHALRAAPSEGAGPVFESPRGRHYGE